MRFLGHRRLPGRAAVIAAALVTGVGGLASPAVGASASNTGPASTTPASGTPYLAISKTQQTIRQLVECGNTMFAVGRLWSVYQNGTKFSRDNVFSFSASAPYTMTGWDPQVDGSVNSIAFTAGHGCGTAFIGGTFTSVDGKTATNIAAISTTSSTSVVSSFERYTNGTVDTMLGYKDHLLVGGKFTRTNGFSRYYFESLAPSTGKVDDFVNLHVEGYVTGASREVYNQQLSHGGTLDLVEGNYTSVGGQPRQQIFMLNLAGSTAQVTGWTSPEFSQHCWAREAFYVRSAAWSPDDSTVYVADTGNHPINWTTGEFPLWGLCDAAAAFPATQTSVSHDWIEYTGCDSYYSVAADDSAVYVAGHPRWANNPDGCNNAGSGAFADQGMQGLNPATGTVLSNSNGTPQYTMSRANGDDMLYTSAGLWIASTNRFGSNECENVTDHSGICFLPSSS
jgi:hypothetical protein